jgi:hypothetical protein
MENKYTNLREVTPREMACVVGACPSIYEGIKELTPKEMLCCIGACPSTYEATREGKEVYLVVGKKINPSDAGLEKKVGEGEALVEIPRALIDNKGK